MSLLAETIVEEYYNYQGYFTIRGVKKGNKEIDLLAIKVSNKKKPEAMHIEVQVSENPVNYISKLSDKLRKELNAKTNSSAVKRTDEQLKVCCKTWVDKKFNTTSIQKLRNRLFPNQQWKYVLIHGNVKSEKELEYFKEYSVQTEDIRNIIEKLTLARLRKFGTSSTGRDIINIFKLFNIEEQDSTSHSE